MFEELLQLDNDIIIYLNSLGSSQFDAFWIFVTTGKNWALLFTFVTFLFLKKFPINKALNVILVGVLTCFITLILVELIKINVGRFRPINNQEIKHLLRIIVEENNFSFVSGHSAFSMTFATYTYLILKSDTKYIRYIFLFPVLFAYSRSYLGVHFLTDILSGLLLGFLIAYLTATVVRSKILKNSI